MKKKKKGVRYPPEQQLYNSNNNNIIIVFHIKSTWWAFNVGFNNNSFKAVWFKMYMYSEGFIYINSTNATSQLVKYCLQYEDSGITCD